MFSIVDVVGMALRGAAALGFAAVCGWSSVFFGTGHAALLAVMGQGGQMAVVGLGALAIFAGFYCILALSRDTRARQSTRALQDEQPAFDAEAIIARHVAWRAANPPAAARRPRSGFHRVPRRGFGQRIV